VNRFTHRKDRHDISEATSLHSAPGHQSRYLVSPYGESDWVRNLRTAGQGELSSKGQTEVFHASEIPVEERADIIAKYREVAGSHMGPYFTKLPDPKDHPVFRVG
jgi:hypothetical protein